jgi:23S rRNA (pseudouridine1915-N3)-methyltransferase
MPRGYEVARIAVRNEERLRAALPKGARVVALDERGKDFTTTQFSTLLNIETAFVIGGPDGLDEGIKKQSALLLRVSSLTLPHALAQVVLMEQLYRAATLLIGHPYHRS